MRVSVLVCSCLGLSQAFVAPRLVVSKGSSRLYAVDVEPAEEGDYARERSRYIPSLQQLGRRETLIGAAAVLASPLLRDLVQPQLGSLPVSAADLETILAGDTIVRNLWLERLSYPLLVVALESGLFEALKSKPLSKEKLGEAMNPSIRGDGRVMEAFVGVLASLKLLQVDQQGTVSLTEPARHVLLQDSPFFWGPQLLAADGVTSSIRRALRRENAPPVDYAGHSDAAVNSFIDSMQAHGAVTAQATAKALDPIIGSSAVNPATHVLDMAGGSGCFASALSARGIPVTLADLPGVVARWRRRNRFSSVDAVPADLFESETWLTGPDCHLMANVLHDWGKPQVKDILKASYSALTQSTKRGGRVVVIEQLLSDDQAGPLPAALASASMLLGDWRTGKQYSFAELETMMKGAGFSKVELGPKCGSFHTAVIGHT